MKKIKKIVVILFLSIVVIGGFVGCGNLVLISKGNLNDILVSFI